MIPGSNPKRVFREAGPIAICLTLVTLIALSVLDVISAQWLFVKTTYYFSMAGTLIWVGTHIHAAREPRWQFIRAWLRDNLPGLCIAVAVTLVAAAAVEPALRVLSDEANLVGTSKNLHSLKSPTFTVSGKHYYGSYWDVDVAIDQRPTLFPFLVSLLHSVLGYTHENAFLLNLLLLPAFVLVAYRLAKSQAGEPFGVVTAFFVVSHPILLLSVRSGGFDFLATLLGLLVVKSWFDFDRSRSPATLALLWVNLCLFSQSRYESALFIVPTVALLLAWKMVNWSILRPYVFVYALTPIFLAPRLWQALLRGSVPPQPVGTVTLSGSNFVNNALEYFEPLLSPSKTFPAHSAVLIALGLVGVALWIGHAVRAARPAGVNLRIATFVGTWVTLQAVVVFAYVWGRAQFPSSARLVLPIDSFFSLAAAWTVTLVLRKCRPHLSTLLAAAFFLAQVPGEEQSRMMNRLTQSRESAATWDFFARLNDERIIIVTDRPNHFTIMNYGAMSFDAARRDPYLLTALSRRLFQNVYVIQQVELSTGDILPGYEIWPERSFETVLEFQNDADVLVRVSRVAQ